MDDESDLEVPNLIVESPEASPEASSSFNLIDEELLQLFAYLSVEDRQRLRGVCSQWRSLIEHTFGIKILIKNSTNALVGLCNSATEVDLNSMTIPFPEENSIAFSRRVKKLTFSNIVVTYNLISFLRACSSNLSHLCFAYIVIDQPISDAWGSLQSQHNNQPISLPFLQTLETKSLAFSDAILELFNFLADKVSYGNLEEIIVQAQNPAVIPLQLIFAHQVSETVHPLLKIIRNNRESLKKFSMGRSNLPTIIKFHPHARRSEDSSSTNITEQWEPPQILLLEIHPYFREEWAPMLRDQHRIEEMRMGSCNVSRWNDIHLAIRSNCLTLKVFSVGGLSFGQIWDCAVFQNCVNLEELSIEISHTHKINFGMLPSNLRSLSVFGPIQRTEIEAISDMLIGLKFLKLTHLGRISEFNDALDDKITLEVFKRLLKIPSLKMLSFNTCSTISIDWDIIASWCSKVNKEESGFIYYERYSSLHGEYLRNGISVELNDSFKRDEFEWDSPEWDEGLVEDDEDRDTDDDGENTRDQHGSRRSSVISFAQPEVRQLDIDEDDDIID